VLETGGLAPCRYVPIRHRRSNKTSARSDFALRNAGSVMRSMTYWSVQAKTSF